MDLIPASPSVTPPSRALLIWLRIAAAASVASMLATAAVMSSRETDPPQMPGPDTQATSINTKPRVSDSMVLLAAVGGIAISPRGSGTLISGDGLILTNAHLAAPRTLGVAVATATAGAALAADPAYLAVALTSGSGPAVIRYRARTVSVDGYLDLAVLEIFADSAGVPVDRARLNLPHLKLGDVDREQAGRAVTVLSFPARGNGSDTVSISTGMISAFLPDPLRHVSHPRFQMETTARTVGQTSGGAAVNADGELIGVPSLALPGPGSSRSWRLRAVDQAVPLITAARSGARYHGVPLVPAGAMQMTAAGIGITPEQACTGNPGIPAGMPDAYFAFRYFGAPPGVDIAFMISMPGGRLLSADPGDGQTPPRLPEMVIDNGTGCVSIQVAVPSLGTSVLPSGQYSAQLLAGPNLDPLNAGVTLSVGT